MIGKFWNFIKNFNIVNFLYLACKILGLAPYNYRVLDGKNRCVPSKLGTLYSLIFVVCYVGLFSYATIASNYVEFGLSKTHSIVATFIDTFQWYITVFIVITLVAANCFSQNTLIKVAIEIDNVNVQLRNSGLEFDNKEEAKTRVAVLIVWHVAFYLIMELLNCSLLLTEMKIIPVICNVLCYIPLLVAGFVKIQFILLIMLVKYKFGAINEKLSRLEKRSVQKGNVVMEI